MVAPRKGRFREVRNTITVNSAIAATTISDPTIGAATNAFLLQPHDGNAGRKQDRAADQVETDVRGRELKAVRESRSSRPVPVFVT